MNALLAAMRRSLAELDLGLKGDLTMTEPMERLMTALAGDAVPPSWALLAYPSLRPLGSWMVNLLARVAQLAEWTADLVVPKSVWLPGARRAPDCRPPGAHRGGPGPHRRARRAQVCSTRSPS
jgi:dynein heavy chain